MVHVGSEEDARNIITCLLSEMGSRILEDGKVILPVMTLEGLIDVGGDLRRAGVDMATGTVADLPLLRLLIRIAIISPDDPVDGRIFAMAESLDDYESMAWAYACGIGTQIDAMSAVSLFRRDPVMGPLYSGIDDYPHFSLLLSYMRNRLDAPDEFVPIHDLFLKYDTSEDPLERLVYGMGIVACLQMHGDLVSSSRSTFYASTFSRLHDRAVFDEIFDVIRPLTYGIRDARYLEDDERREDFSPIEAFVKDFSAEWMMYRYSSAGYLSDPSPYGARVLLDIVDEDGLQVYRIRHALHFCPEDIVLRWIYNRHSFIDGLVGFEREMHDQRFGLEAYDLDLEDDESEDVPLWDLAPMEDLEVDGFVERDEILVRDDPDEIHQTPWYDMLRDPWELTSDGNPLGPVADDVVWTTLRSAFLGVSDAQFEMGALSMRSGDLEDAREWFEIAAARGQMEAQYNLGAMYLGGLGVEEDRLRGVSWMIDSSLNQNIEAQALLGCLNRDSVESPGIPGQERSDTEAAMWTWLAASHGHGTSCYNLGVMYERGVGVGASVELATFWFGQAEQAGIPQAKARLLGLKQGDPGTAPDGPGAEHPLASLPDVIVPPLRPYRGSDP